MKYKFGVMSSVHSFECDDQLLAIATMVILYGDSANLVAVYEPKECPKWFSVVGDSLSKLNEIYKERGGFEKYLTDNSDAIRKMILTVKEC